MEQQRGDPNVPAELPAGVPDLQALVDTGAARSFSTLSELLGRRPIRIPQLLDTLDETLMIMDVSRKKIFASIFVLIQKSSVRSFQIFFSSQLVLWVTSIKLVLKLSD